MTVNELKSRIAAVNALGVQNLAAKGVTVAANADTHTVVSAISQISGGGGGFAFRDPAPDGRPRTVDLTGWTPASLSDNAANGLTDCCLPANAFVCDSTYCLYYLMTKLICPHTLTGIGSKAFSFAINLVLDGDAFPLTELQRIGPYAFSRCRHLNDGGLLTDLRLPKLRSLGGSAFAAASGNGFVAGDVVLGSAGHPVELIGANALQYQSGVTSLTVYTANGAALADEGGNGWGCGTAAVFVTA